MAVSGDLFAVGQSPCVSADPSEQAEQHAQSFGTNCCSELQATGFVWWGARDHNHAKSTAVVHLNFGEKYCHLQDMLLGMVENLLERLRFAAHSLDANWWDIEGAGQADSWAKGNLSLCDRSSRRHSPYRAARPGCCVQMKLNCHSLKSTARNQSVHLSGHFDHDRNPGRILDYYDLLCSPYLCSHWSPRMVGKARNSFERPSAALEGVEGRRIGDHSSLHGIPALS